MIPQLRAWHERYEGKGFTIVGVHSPEFFWEKPHEKVADAIGEGAYDETEAMIRRLLGEGG